MHVRVFACTCVILCIHCKVACSGHKLKKKEDSAAHFLKRIVSELLLLKKIDHFKSVLTPASELSE